MEKLLNQPCLSKDGMVEAIYRICKDKGYNIEPFLEAIKANEIGWFSRSVAVACVIVKVVEDKIYVLIEQRGKGAADFQGQWCTVCGYLEFGQTLKDCAAAEALQECGFEINKPRLHIMGVTDGVEENHQNVTVLMYYHAEEYKDFDLSKAKGGEKDEVADVKWVHVGDIDREDDTWDMNGELSKYEFAFGHKDVIVKAVLKVMENCYG